MNKRIDIKFGCFDKKNFFKYCFQINVFLWYNIKNEFEF